MVAVNQGGMTRKKVVKFAAMGIVLGIALGIVLSILALNLFITLGDFAWLQDLLVFEATKECVDQENNNKMVEAIRQRRGARSAPSPRAGRGRPTRDQLLRRHTPIPRHLSDPVG